MTMWFESTKMNINAEKFEATHFGRRRPETIIKKIKDYITKLLEKLMDFILINYYRSKTLWTMF